jgi:hypothetical protein
MGFDAILTECKRPFAAHLDRHHPSGAIDFAPGTRNILWPWEEDHRAVMLRASCPRCISASDQVLC